MTQKNNKDLSIKILKAIIIVLIPLVFLEMVLYYNLSSKDFNYFYDIGGVNDNYLSPTERISDKISEESVNYRNLTNGLVYFDIPIIKNTDKIDLQIKFKDNFPENSKFSVGAKDQEEWHYKSNWVYDKTIEDLIKKYPYQTQDNLILFKLNKDAEDYTINDCLTNPPAIRFATSLNITPPEFRIADYQPKELSIDTQLRGTQRFYVYIKEDFSITVWKKDLNMYNNYDELTITLYDLNGKAINSKIIPDDGIANASNQLTK